MQNETVLVTAIEFNSPQFHQCVQLRRRLLREPLGLDFTDKQLSEESENIHFGAFHNNNDTNCNDEDGKETVALGTLQLVIIDQSTLKLRQMAVDSQKQRRGIGRLLVQLAEQWARLAGYQRVELHARVVARGFYERLGYSPMNNGLSFMEVGLAHVKMFKSLSNGNLY